MTSARQKLNKFNFLGAVIFAALAGFVFQSWLVFAIAAVLLVVASLNSGDIRMSPDKNRRR